MKLKILVVADVENWCFWNTDVELKKHLTQFDIDIMYQKQFLDTFSDGRPLPYNNVYLQNWAIDGIDYSKFISNVCSHRLETDSGEKSDLVVPQYRSISCVSMKLLDICQKRYPTLKCFPGLVGVDSDLFKPNYTQSDKFRVGFSSKKMAGGFQGDLKGYHTLLLPLIERMKKYPDIEFLVNDRNHQTSIPHDQMPSKFHQMDCFLQTSYREGGSNNLMEAASCGVPCISTDTGVASLLLDPFYIIPAFNSPEDIPATLDAFEQKILYLKENRHKALENGLRNRLEVVDNWTWKKMAQQWVPFFEFNPLEKIENWKVEKKFKPQIKNPDPSKRKVWIKPK